MATDAILDIENARVDARSLSEFVWKPAGFMVSRRLAPPTNTLQYYIDLFENISIGGEFNSAKIESLTVTTSAAGTNASVVTGGTPSNRTFALTIPRGDTGAKGADGKDGSFTQKAYSTEALMIADKASIPANTSVDVTNDPTSSKNGTYAYNGTTFTKSAYDPTNLAKNYTDSSVKAAFDRMGATFAHAYDPTYLPYVEMGVSRSDKVYFKFGPLGLHLTAPNTGQIATLSWEKLKADLGATGEFKTSPKGMADTLEVFDQSLIYNTSTSKFELVPRFDVKPSIHVDIATFAFGGLVRGLLFDNWLSHRDDLVRQIQFYPGDGHTDSDTPYTEQAISSEPDAKLYLYLKLPSLRLRNPIRTEPRLGWDTIKADILSTSKSTIKTRPIADFIQTSPKGVPDCLKLYDEALIYNVWTYKFSVVDKNFAPDPYIEVVVASVAYGQLQGGLIFDWWMSKRVKRLENRPAGGGGDSSYVKPVSRPAPKYIAHGGVSGPHFFLPFNSITAVRAAGEYGYWGIETDIVETKDGEWVHIHDTFLSVYVNAPGNVKDYTLAELKAFQAGKPSIQYGWDKVQLMELRECLDACVQYNLVPVLEFKSVPTASGINKVVGYIRERMDISNSVLSSFDQSVVTLVRTLHPDAPTSLITIALTQQQLDFAVATGNCYLSSHTSSTQLMLNKAKAAGIDISIWPILQPDIELGKTAGCKYIVTDMGVAYDFKGGVQVLNFKSNADFSNMTSVGVGSVDSKQLTVTASTATYDVPVNRGDVVTASCIARSTGAVTFELYAYNAAGTYLRTYTKRTINKTTDDLYTVAAIAYDADVSKVTVAFVAPSGVSMVLENIRVKKFEV